MNGLKKFQEFALNADEQKNVKGGLLAAWRCIIETASGSWHTDYAGTSEQAVTMCRRAGSACVGCFN